MKSNPGSYPMVLFLAFVQPKYAALPKKNATIIFYFGNIYPSRRITMVKKALPFVQSLSLLIVTQEASDMGFITSFR